MENHPPASLAVTGIRLSMSDSPQRPWEPSPSWSVRGCLASQRCVVQKYERVAVQCKIVGSALGPSPG